MKLKPILTITFAFILIQSACADMKQDIADYIAKYKDVALEEMVRCKIPASITLAQGLHESGYGKSKLTTEANNHFGIKCKDEWDGKKFFQNDDAPNECFRVYEHAEDSYADHSDFLVTRSRYAALFELPITDYKGWATGLKASGYATNPRYAEILIKTIEDNDLSEFDKQGLAMIEQKEKLLAQGSTDNQQTTTAQIEKPLAQPEQTHMAKREAIIAKPAKATFTTATSSSNQTEYTVNGIRTIKAQGSVDPLTIAFNYQIPYAQVLAFNDMNEADLFKDGQNIFLQNKKARAAEEKYVAQLGESMQDISQKFGVKLRDLYQKNLMARNDQPVSGETIYLQEKRTTPARSMTYSEFLKTLNTTGAKASNATTPINTSNSTKQYSSANLQYTVRPSDTLYSIAKQFNTTVQQLEAANNLQSPDLHQGQTIVIAK